MAIHQSLSPKPMSLYPTMGSLKEAQDLAESKLPVTDKNEMLALLMIYHNTLLKAVEIANNVSQS